MIFSKKKQEENFEAPFAVVEETDVAKENFLSDGFNKVIRVYKNWNMFLNKKPNMEFTYTEEDARNVREVWKMPIIEIKNTTPFDFFQGESFGEIRNKIEK